MIVVSDCAHSEPGDPRPSLDVYFSRPSLVHEYVIYNRAGDLNYQMMGFNLTVYDQRSEQVLTYSDQLTQPLKIYVIKTRVQVPVSRVNLVINEYPTHVHQRTKILQAALVRSGL
ncbi:uncharacterized protein LOC131930973 [Physella acuta]|uniref:uncharacterized protein LOC131930973 n=1 Tax=Physella acuta TaxID=109671 RepID=UPI0027DCC72A|nr:uncharacterized protein LOC131930973 [Physella acuta]